jgi:integrase/recombinase XerD
LRRNCAYLFQSQQGNCFTQNTMRPLIMGINAECGLEGAASHSGRRTLLTRLSSAGISVRVLCELAGHSSIATTQRYIDVNDEQMRGAI